MPDIDVPNLNVSNDPESLQKESMQYLLILVFHNSEYYIIY